MKRMWSRKELQQIAVLMAVAQMQSGDVENVKVFENIVDKDGHKRFVEGSGTPMTSEGFTASYCKWSLSGTHLMFVLAGSFENGANVPTATNFASYQLPKWIYDKIYPVFASTRIEIKKVDLYADDWSAESSSPYLTLTISSDSSISLVNIEQAFTTTKARAFRVEFDLLIDNE